MFNFPTTAALIASIRSSPRRRRLCGWESLSEVPGKSTFSRYFGAFAEDGTALLAFHSFVAKVSEGRMAIGASFDSTKVAVRERPASKEEKAAAAEAARARAGISGGNADPNALALQRGRGAETNIALLPAQCDRGRKKDSKGSTVCWIRIQEAERSAGLIPAEKMRYRARSGVERVNGHLHDAHGGRFVRVRGAKKVFLHLLFGLLVIAVEQAAQIL